MMDNNEKEKKMIICDVNPLYRFQGPRFIRLGKGSGEEFRDMYLIPWLKELKTVNEGVIDFSGTIVYSPSFLEESFGGAIRKGFSEQVKKLSFENIEDTWNKKLQSFIFDALKTIRP